MNFTIRRDGDEYNARNRYGTIVGSVYFLKEHEGGQWKHSAKVTGAVGFHDDREAALLALKNDLDGFYAAELEAMAV